MERLTYTYTVALGHVKSAMGLLDSARVKDHMGEVVSELATGGNNPALGSLLWMRCRTLQLETLLNMKHTKLLNQAFEQAMSEAQAVNETWYTVQMLLLKATVEMDAGHTVEVMDQLVEVCVSYSVLFFATL